MGDFQVSVLVAMPSPRNSKPPSLLKTNESREEHVAVPEMLVGVVQLPYRTIPIAEADEPSLIMTEVIRS
jgi:hypothetical protein